MDNSISRQAAIDAMAELQGRASTKAELKGISKAWKWIKKLPSAQPEIIRCKDCQYHGMAICRIWSRYGTINTPGYGFCFRGERRTDETD